MCSTTYADIKEKQYTMTQHKYATLFGGALDITDTTEYLDTICIGHILAEKGYVVKNGGYGGMMEFIKRTTVAMGEMVKKVTDFFNVAPTELHLKARHTNNILLIQSPTNE